MVTSLSVRCISPLSPEPTRLPGRRTTVVLPVPQRPVQSYGTGPHLHSCNLRERHTPVGHHPPRRVHQRYLSDSWSLSASLLAEHSRRSARRRRQPGTRRRYADEPINAGYTQTSHAEPVCRLHTWPTSSDYLTVVPAQRRSVVPARCRVLPPQPAQSRRAASRRQATPRRA